MSKSKSQERREASMANPKNAESRQNLNKVFGAPKKQHASKK